MINTTNIVLNTLFYAIIFIYVYKEISLVALVNYNNRHSCGVTSLRKINIENKNWK